MLPASVDASALDEDRAARQSDAAQDDEDDGQHDAQHGVRVLERVEGEIALRAYRDIPAVQRRMGMRVLVQTQRDDPAGDDEEEDRHACDLGQTRPHRPAGDGHDRSDPQEDGADAVVVGVGGGAGHEVRRYRQGKRAGQLPPLADVFRLMGTDRSGQRCTEEEAAEKRGAPRRPARGHRERAADAP